MPLADGFGDKVAGFGGRYGVVSYAVPCFSALHGTGACGSFGCSDTAGRAAAKLIPLADCRLVR